MAGQQVIVSILGDIKDFQRKMSDTQDTANKTFTGIAGAVAGSKMFAALADLGDQALDSMKDYGDQFDALADQLGADSAQSFVDGFAANVVGANIQEAMGIGSELAKTITGTLGLAGEQAQAVTEQMTQGVLDIAASTDTAADQVTAAVASFLQGKDKALAKTMGLDGDYVRGLVEQKMKLDGLTESQARHAVLMEMMGDRAGEALADTETLSGALKEMTDGFEDAGTSLIQSLMPLVMDAAKFVTGTVVPAVKTLTEWIRDNETIVKILAVTLAVLVGAFQALSGALAVVSALQAAAGIFKSLEAAQKLSAAAQLLVNAAMTANPIGLLITAIAALVAGLIWFFTQTDEGRKIWEKFTQFLTESWEQFTRFMGEAWESIVGFFTSAGDAVKKAWDGTVKWFSEIPARVKKFFSDTANWLVQAGKDLVSGLWKGFTDDLDSIKRGVSDFGRNFEQWVKDAFGINSPSRMMYDLFKWLMPGAAKALADGQDEPLDVLDRFKSRFADLAQGDDLTLAMATMQAGGVVNLYRFGDVDIEVSNAEEQSAMNEFISMLQRKTRAGV